MNINMSSIMGKVKAFSESPEGKRRIKECLEKYKKEGRTVTEAGSVLFNDETMLEAAGKFINVLKDAARDALLPTVRDEESLDSVMKHFDSLDYSAPVKMPDGSAVIYVYFKDDLHRDSLQPDKWDGVENIIAVLNNGYDKHENMGKVWGVWHGARVHALTERTGLRFIQQAIMDFNGNYGSEYNVTAEAGSDYI